MVTADTSIFPAFNSPTQTCSTIDIFAQNRETSFRADLSSACGARKTYQLKRLTRFGAS